MSLSNLNEIKDKVQELTVVLREDNEYAFVCGYMESFFTRVIMSYVPANRHHELIELLNSHINKANDGE